MQSSIHMRPAADAADHTARLRRCHANSPAHAPTHISRTGSPNHPIRAPTLPPASPAPQRPSFAWHAIKSEARSVTMLHPRCLRSCWRGQGHIGVSRHNLIFAYLMIQRRLMDFRIRVGGCHGTTSQSRLQLIIEYFNLEFKRQEHVSRSTRHARRSADAG